MEDTYYFSQGRLVRTETGSSYNKFKDATKDIEMGLASGIDKDLMKNATAAKAATAAAAPNCILYRLWNFSLYNKSVLRYKL
uniref:Uncharacterized protein n=1 Tax=viral metagenome TaxID=1070528 RepID=A0A6C0K892_9ZZZZ